VIRRRRTGTRAGNAAIEFGLIGPVLVTAIIVLFETGVQMMTGAMLDYGVRIASRYGVTGEAAPNGATREAYIRSLILTASGGFLTTDRLTITLKGYASWGNAASNTGATNGPGASGNVVSYAVTYRAALMTPPAQVMLGVTEIIHNGSIMVNNEPYPIQ